MILCLGGYVLDPRLTDSYLAYCLTLHPLFSLSPVACFWIFQAWLSLTLKIGSVSLSHSVRASDVLRRTFPLFHGGCENSPQPFHGTQATPVMPSTKSRPWDWHRPAPPSCFVTRHTALQPVGIWGLLGLDWLWGHCRPPCRFPDSSRILFVVGVRSFCSDLSQEFSRTQRGHTYFSARSVQGLQSWPLWWERCRNWERSETTNSVCVHRHKHKLLCSKPVS
jgi:hypothetical protein